MRIPRSIGACLALPALALGLLLAGCGGEPESPEAQVRAVLAELEQAAESADVGAFKERVSERYRDDYGNDKRGLAAYVTFHVMRSQRRQVVLNLRDVHLASPTLAEVSLHVGLGGSGGGRGLRADVYAVEIDLEDEGDGDWKMVWAQWQSAPATDLL